jgi:hypothetical protein
MLLASKIADAVRSRVADPRIVSDVVRELQSLLGHRMPIDQPPAETIDEPRDYLVGGEQSVDESSGDGGDSDSSKSAA